MIFCLSPRHAFSAWADVPGVKGSESRNFYYIFRFITQFNLGCDQERTWYSFPLDAFASGDVKVCDGNGFCPDTGE